MTAPAASEPASRHDERSPRPSKRSISLIALLILAMVASTYQQSALAVLSGDVLEEFDISRSRLGLIFTAASLFGAAVAPMIGRVADRTTRGVLFGLFLFSGVGILLLSTAGNYELMLLGALFGGLAIGSANPVTNRVISERVSTGRRGLALGLKQSGPPMSSLIAGLALPGLAVLLGWRGALAFGLILSLVGAVGTRLLVPGVVKSAIAAPPAPPLAPQVRTSVRWLNAIGFAIATGNGALLAFLPLYAQEGVSFSATSAGLVAAVLGLCGVAGRIAWGARASRFDRPSTALIAIAGLAVAAMILIGVSSSFGAVTLWSGTVLAGFSSMAWHAVAWLVIIDRVGTAGVGRASGIMQTGSSVGFAIGPFLAGAMIDATGTYWAAWGPVAGLFAIAMFMTMSFRRQTTRRRKAEAAAAAS